ncbi:hypothetical protein DFH27DRAFT_525799 [Peziza echinospora]|nr:hypothetical protein DFH27DRAFT_525799 [Peziza echinospora]
MTELQPYWVNPATSSEHIWSPLAKNEVLRLLSPSSSLSDSSASSAILSTSTSNSFQTTTDSAPIRDSQIPTDTTMTQTQDLNDPEDFNDNASVTSAATATKQKLSVHVSSTQSRFSDLENKHQEFKTQLDELQTAVTANEKAIAAIPATAPSTHVDSEDLVRTVECIGNEQRFSNLVVFGWSPEKADPKIPEWKIPDIDARCFLSTIEAVPARVGIFSAYRRGRASTSSTLFPPLVITFENKFKCNAAFEAFLSYRRRQPSLPPFNAKIDTSQRTRARRAKIQKYVTKIRDLTGKDARLRPRDEEHIAIFGVDPHGGTVLTHLLPKAQWPSLSATSYTLPSPTPSFF